ncbi:MAG: hypothetical protein RSD78_07705 [Oscillospiraceae bacterium]
MKRILSLIISAAMLISMTACGKNAQKPSDGAASASGADTNIAMGRWIESEIKLPIENASAQNAPYLMQDGSLVMFALDNINTAEELGKSKMHKLVSKDNGETWQDEIPSWNEKVGGTVFMAAMSPNGTMLLQSMADVKSTRTTWLQTPNGELKQIDLSSTFENYESASRFMFINDDVFYFEKATTRLADGSFSDAEGALFSTETLSKIGNTNPQDSDSGIMSTVVVMPCVATDGERMYLMPFGKDGRSLISIEKDSTTNTILPNVPDAQGAYAATTDKDGNYYFAADGGIYRVAKGGSIVENVVDGAGLSFTLENHNAYTLAIAANGDFIVQDSFGTSNDDHGFTYYRYHFDETLPMENSDKLTIWSLEDIPSIRAAVVNYSKNNPQLTVDYQIAVNGKDMDEGAKRTAKEDALRSLNTELLSGKGPDLLIMDGVDYAPYIAKGILADLSKAIPLDALVPNITSPFKSDKGVFVMPARFAVPVIFGKQGEVENLTDLNALQKEILTCPKRPDINYADEGYYSAPKDTKPYALSFMSISQLVDFALNSCAPALVKSGKVDNAAVEEMFGFIKSVSDYYGISEYRTAQEYNGITLGSGGDTVEMYDCSLEYTQVKRVKYGRETMKTPALLTSGIWQNADKGIDQTPRNAVVQPGLCEGAYFPSCMVGVRAGSAKIDAAMDFVKILFSDKAQGTFNGDGMPVLADALTQSIKQNSKDTERFTYKGDINGLIAGLKTPITINAAVYSKVFAHAEALCKGSETISEAVSGVKKDLSLYLSERE